MTRPVYAHGPARTVAASRIAAVAAIFWMFVLSGYLESGAFLAEPQAQADDPSPSAGEPAAHGRAVSSWVDLTGAIGAPRAFPPPAEDCAIIYDPVGQRVLVFGGKADDDRDTNDVWALDMAAKTWSKVVAQGGIPPTVEDHAAIYDPIGHRAIIHGGEDGFSRNSTWALDLKTSTWRDITRPAGPAVEDHSALFDSRGKRMIVFGGRNKQAGHDEVDLDEVWAFDLDPTSSGFETWTDLTVKADRAVGRCEHAAIWDERKNRMVIFGGWGKRKKECLDDTWTYTCADSREAPGRWDEVKAKHSHPPKRRHVASAYDSSRNWLVICGGFGDEGYLNDAWAFDLEKDLWINVTPGPQPRLDHRAIFDPVNRRMMVYGGDAHLAGKLHDLWELEINPDAPLEQMLRQAAEKPRSQNPPPPG